MGAINMRPLGDARPYVGRHDAAMGLDEATCRLIWEQFLTTRRVVEEIAGIVPGVSVRQVRHVLRMGIFRPSTEEEARLREAFVITVPDPSRLYAAPGLLVSDIADLPGIEAAISDNRNAVAALRAEMDEADLDRRKWGSSKPPRWWAIRKGERSYLKAVMESLNHHRGTVAKAERQRRHLARQEARDQYLLKVVRELDEGLFQRAVELARERNPGLMGTPPGDDAQAGQAAVKEGPRHE